MTIKRMRITVDGRSYDVSVEMLSDSPAAAALRPSPVAQAATLQQVVAEAPAPRAPAAPGSRPDGAVVCSLSGTVVSVHVAEGQQVKVGDLLVTLEAMKLNTAVRATQAGTVKDIRCKAGQTVEENAVLLVVA